jgi:aldose 1-epimerase
VNSGRPWGTLGDSRVAQLFTLRNAGGMEVVLSNLGATLVSWFVRDSVSGAKSNIVLGHDRPVDYLKAKTFMGGTIGRWANRIAAGQFGIRGMDYQLDTNEGRNHLHGGTVGLHRQLWDASHAREGVTFIHRSANGESGFPATVDFRVQYSLSDEGDLDIVHEAEADAPTLVNLTNHSYFNLANSAESIRDHLIRIEADRFLEVSHELLPTRTASVDGTAFDFRKPQVIGERLDWKHEQFSITGGFDHCYVLGDEEISPALRRAAVLFEPSSGRELTVSTNSRGLQFYTGNYLAGVRGRQGREYQKHAGLCLEPGEFPNAPNMDGAEKLIVEPGSPYRHTIRYSLRTL